MSRHEATFETASKTSAYAVERLVDRLYDTVRERRSATPPNNQHPENCGWYTNPEARDLTTERVLRPWLAGL